MDPTNGFGLEKVLLEHSITPVHQYSYTSGKNATDSSMIIDAMDILYTGRVDGFCIVSSDSDFTRLASRLREGGMVVFGLGEKKTPVSFISACDKFIYIEILKKTEDIIKPEILTKSKGKSKQKKLKQKPLAKLTINYLNLLQKVSMIWLMKMDGYF